MPSRPSVTSETGEALRAAGGGGELLLTGGLPDLVEAYVRMGDAARACETLEQLEAIAERIQRTWTLAAAARCRGLLSATEFDAHSNGRSAFMRDIPTVSSGPGRSSATPRGCGAGVI